MGVFMKSSVSTKLACLGIIAAVSILQVQVGAKKAAQSLSIAGVSFTTAQAENDSYSPPYASPFVASDDPIVNMYHNLLQREPDADGLKFWQYQLASGAMSIDDITNGFVQSPEFQQLHAYQPSQDRGN
jgi:hypothetical protein